MLYNDDHLDFEVKLKRYVHLEVLLEALNRDKKQLGHLKMAEVYEDQIDYISDQILKDMAELRRYFRQSQGEIIQTVQLVGERMVEYVWKGYRLKVKYLNEFMRVECGEILKGYMKLKRGDQI
ncbi:hypothetical protein [Laceyella putida]|uniref:Uncharacterized protein n=1 Tax=Laceyella putida TaxID=110101 RepID=A0ABW2RK85_9BACL